MIEHPLIHEPGVFFGLPEAEYHAALAQSASGIKNLRVSTLDWWVRSPLNPEPHEEPPSIQMLIGTAAHKRILEGREAFYDHYAPTLERDHYPTALETNEDLTVAIINAGGPKPRGNLRKDDLIELAKTYIDSPLIWQELVSLYRQRNVGKTLLKQETINQIEVAAAMIEKHPELGRAFRDGEPEVSIFWTDESTGVPCKARLDYLKPRLIVDLKTFSNPYGMSIDKAIARVAANYRYHVQAAWYLEAVEAARTIPLMHYHPTEPNIINKTVFLTATVESLAFLFVFQQQGIAPVARGKLFGPGLVMDIARQEIEQAKLTWARCWETFGPDEPWIDTTGISEFDDSEFPAYIGE